MGVLTDGADNAAVRDLFLDREAFDAWAARYRDRLAPGSCLVLSQFASESDPEAMAVLYAPDATFSDPAFGHLQGAEVRSMWRMLVGASKDLSVTARDITANGDRAADGITSA